MSHYIDGFVVPVPKVKLAAYRALARKACKRMFWGGFKTMVEL